MKLNQFDAWSRAELEAVESALGAWVPADAPAGLGEAMRYGVLDGGKRLRPLLVLAAAACVGGVREAARSAASRAPPSASHDASTSSGRSRLPPSSTP